MPELNHQLIAEARAKSAADGSRLVEVLQELCGLENAEFVEQLAALFHFEAMDMAQLHGLQPLFDVVSYPQAAKRGCVAARNGADATLLLFSDPFDASMRAWAQGIVPQHDNWRLAHHTDIAAYLALHESSIRAVEDALREAGASDEGREEEDISLRSIGEDGSPTVKLVNSALYDALKAGASDIHLESTPNGMVIKNRIDGVLNHIGEVRGRENGEQAISRIKVMAELDIAEHRIPQMADVRGLVGIDRRVLHQNLRERRFGDAFAAL